MAASIRQGSEELLAANAKDVQAAERAKLASAMVERLKLNDKRIAAMADGVEQIAAQVDPVGQVIEGYIRPNGLRIQKVRVPIGVVLFFYESRPNVTSDAAALCLKSGNAIILRGGKEAFETNRAIVRMIHLALRSADESLVDAVQLVESTDRALVPLILKQDRTIDLVIPRGGESLIRAVVADSTIPVLKHFTGNCHIYIDRDTQGMEQQVREICVNAKTSYPGGGVCNAVEHLLFHRESADRLLKNVCEDLAAKGVEIRGDDRARKLYPSASPAAEADWDTTMTRFEQRRINNEAVSGSAFNFTDMLHQELCLQLQSERRWEALADQMSANCVPMSTLFGEEGALVVMLENAMQLVIDGIAPGIVDTDCGFDGPDIPAHFETSLDTIAQDRLRYGGNPAPQPPVGGP